MIFCWAFGPDKQGFTVLKFTIVMKIHLYTAGCVFLNLLKFQMLVLQFPLIVIYEIKKRNSSTSVQNFTGVNFLNSTIFRIIVNVY